MVHFPGSANAARRFPRPQIGRKDVFIRCRLVRAVPRCHSDILNYITISHAQAFFKVFLTAAFAPLERKLCCVPMRY